MAGTRKKSTATKKGSKTEANYKLDTRVYTSTKVNCDGPDLHPDLNREHVSFVVQVEGFMLFTITGKVLIFIWHLTSFLYSSVVHILQGSIRLNLNLMKSIP